jgi:CSLREA domain-containing protein
MHFVHARARHLKPLAVVVAWLLGAPLVVPAAPVFVVNSADDVVGDNPGNHVCETRAGNGTCTLRRAIIEANHMPGGGATVDLSAVPGGLVRLTIVRSGPGDEATGDLDVTNSMDIIGGGPSVTVVDGNLIDRVFAIAPGASVRIAGLTIRNGAARTSGESEPARGGGLLNEGALTLSNSIVTGNQAADQGGGVFNSGTLIAVRSTVTGNDAFLGGGLINDGTLTLTSSTVSQNSANRGGGILNQGSLTVINTTVSGNEATGDGGGVLNSGVARAFSSTITNNQADRLSRRRGSGGGVFNDAGATFDLQNTIVAGNPASDCAGDLRSSGNNLMQTVQDCTITGDVTITEDPRLGPLQDNGGPTQTHALLASSPAVDAGSPTGCRDDQGAPLETDQRGLPRGLDGNPCDIGAYEVQPGAHLVAAVLPGSRSVQVEATATAFGTIINGGSTLAVGCRITPASSVPAAFHYRATDSTNQLIGGVDVPIDIPAGAAQSFVFGFTPDQAFPPTDVQLTFECVDSNPAAVTTGLNTLLLSASTTPVPDIVALATTATNDGIASIPGTVGTGSFAVATANVGVTGSITAWADTGTATLPVTLALCQTDPDSGSCLAPPGATITTTMRGGATATFGVFMTATGPVPFDPATNRVFVRFMDSGTVTRGSTSVAVRTP